MTTAITPEAAERVVAALPGDHRWEITPEGNLVVRPPATGRQAKIVMQLAAWFIRDGIDPVCLLPRCRHSHDRLAVRALGEDRRYQPGRSVLMSELLTTDAMTWLAGS